MKSDSKFKFLFLNKKLQLYVNFVRKSATEIGMACNTRWLLRRNIFNLRKKKFKATIFIFFTHS